MSQINAGDIYYYPYLWKREGDNGETEGRKPRECAFIAKRVDAKGDTNLFILATTGSFDGTGEAVEIPDMEKHRAGLEADKQLWVVIDEYNHGILGKSFYFTPNRKCGAFSQAFTAIVYDRFFALVSRRKVNSVRRVT